MATNDTVENCIYISITRKSGKINISSDFWIVLMLACYSICKIKMHIIVLFYQIFLLLGIIQIKISNNFLIGYSNVVQVLLYPAVPAVIEVLVKVVDPVPHLPLPGELPLAHIKHLAIIQRGNLPVVTEGRKGALNLPR